MDFIQIGRGFIEGVALILSPCILPVLPFVLGASADGGKRRPFGIIAGFIISFSLFALLSRSLVQLIGVDPNAIRTGSLWLLLFFGLVMLSPQLSNVFSRWTQGAANAGNKLQQKGNEGGFFSGLAIGALIGLIWTPCAGPILGVVLVHVLQQQTNLQAVLVIVSFAVGAGIPMLMIALYGRSVIANAKFLTRHTEELRRGFGVLIILAVVYIAFGDSIQARFFPNTGETASSSSVPLQLENGEEKPYPAPAFAGLQEWINSAPLAMEQLKGKVVLVDFWTYSCINCVRTLPYLTAWDKKYRDQGLVIVGIHAPEFEFEKDISNVRAAVIARGIHYPVAQDNNLTTWNNYHNEYWPAHYLIDRHGQVVYTHFGEGKYDVTENNIRYLLGLKEKATTEVAHDAGAAQGQTPETYLGYARAENFSGDGGLKHDIPADYTYPAGNLPLHHWALKGRWQAGDKPTQALAAGATLRLTFKARKVNIVMGSADGKPVQVKILLNGAMPGGNSGRDVKDGIVTVTRDDVYEAVSYPDMKEGLLEIEALRPGLSVYALTFGG